MPRVSIIVPNRNYARFLPDCLESVRTQTFRDWECIIIDDASTDDSVDIIQKYCKQDKRFRLIRHDKCLGISVTRNDGLDVATGEYIAFMDSDDCFVQTALELLVNMAASTDADMAGAQTMIVPDYFKFEPMENAAVSPPPFSWQARANEHMSMGKSFNWVWIWRRIYRRDMIGDTRFLPEFTGAGDDICFMLDICHKSSKFVETPAISTYHRAHTNSVTSGAFSKECFEFFIPLFRHIRNNLLDKYDMDFWKRYMNGSFKYLLTETIFRPSQYKLHQEHARQVLRECLKLIPKKYLTTKNRIFAWFLQW
ncbi:MAG: glycosyltransferase family 2 protein [Alphaproteobacteria bacterium]|nr:glycosyltransferase family 2 protein [Alphaproteobacteria bacterium]